MFGSLWVVELPPNFTHEGLGDLYRDLRFRMNDIVGSGRVNCSLCIFPYSNLPIQGHLAMPLLGTHPAAGVSPYNAFEEILGDRRFFFAFIFFPDRSVQG